MEEMSWSYRELMDCPYEKYLDYSRIMTLEQKHKKKQQEKQKKKVKTA